MTETLSRKHIARDSQLSVVISRDLEGRLLLHFNKRLQTQIVLFSKIPLTWILRK